MFGGTLQESKVMVVFKMSCCSLFSKFKRLISECECFVILKKKTIKFADVFCNYNLKLPV